jgi:hypothetical protein
MAKRIKTIWVDDIDGTTADETVEFSIDGTSYEIDLNAEHAAQLRAAFGEWTAKARKTGGKRQRAGKPSGQPTAEIRAWAAANGYEVSQRGRISAEIVAAYNAAH